MKTLYKNYQLIVLCNLVIVVKSKIIKENLENLRKINKTNKICQ